MVRSLETVGKKCTSSGANKPKGKNDTYLQILEWLFLSQKKMEQICFLASESKMDQCIESKSNKVQ